MNIGGVSLYLRKEYPDALVISQDGRGRELNEVALHYYAGQQLESRFEWIARCAQHFEIELLYVELPPFTPPGIDRQWFIRDLEARISPQRTQVVGVRGDDVNRLREYAALLIRDGQLTLTDRRLQAEWEHLDWTQRDSGHWRAEAHNPTQEAITDAVAVFAQCWYPSTTTVQLTLRSPSWRA